MSADFSRPVIETVAKRAGNICSNPDCGAMTSGPAKDEGRSINVGEAAHIFGARAFAARFDEQMSDADRASSSNAIWLCRNCHKAIDADVERHPAELLFEWRRAHEIEISSSLGKAGALLRLKIQNRKLSQFEDCSYLAQQIILDKPKYWEQILTSELLRHFLEPVRLRWDALKKGLYALPLKIISVDEYIPWHQVQITMFTNQGQALGGILNGELQQSWGPLGHPGSETEIVRMSKLIKEASEHMLAWEEGVRFVRVPKEFELARNILAGLAGRNLERIFTISAWLAEIPKNPNQPHEYTIKFDFPERWDEDHAAAIAHAAAALGWNQ
jgi:hypothetical protein